MMIQHPNSSASSVLKKRIDANPIHADRRLTQSFFQKCKAFIKSIFENLDFECKCEECQEYYQSISSTGPPMVQDESYPTVHPIVLSVVHLPSFSASPALDITKSSTSKKHVQGIPLAAIHEYSTLILNNTGFFTDERPDQRTTLSTTLSLSFFAATTLPKTNNGEQPSERIMDLRCTQSQTRSNATIQSPETEMRRKKSKPRDIITTNQTNSAQIKANKANTLECNTAIFPTSALPIRFQENTFDSFSYHLLDSSLFESDKTSRSWSIYSHLTFSTDPVLSTCIDPCADELTAEREIWSDLICPFSPLYSTTALNIGADMDTYNVGTGATFGKCRFQALGPGSKYTTASQFSEEEPFESFNPSEWYSNQVFGRPKFIPHWPDLEFPKKTPAIKQHSRPLLSRMLKSRMPSGNMVVSNELSTSLECHVSWENEMNRIRFGLMMKKKNTLQQDIIAHPSMLVTFW